MGPINCAPNPTGKTAKILLQYFDTKSFIDGFDFIFFSIFNIDVVISDFFGSFVRFKFSQLME